MENTVSNAPAYQLKTNKGLLKTILLSLINTVASKYDGRRTMHFCLLTFVIAPITCGIAALVWYNNISDRIGAELRRRGVDYSFGAGTYWGWGFFGSLLFGVGPLVYLHKLFKATNLMNADYNVNG